MRGQPAPDDERFWYRVEFTETCWLWHGYRDRRGYGQFKSNSHPRMVLVHRWAYERLGNKIPDGLTLDHLCRNTSCLRPDHLEPVTKAENTRRQPYSAAQWQTAKTHCPKGHPYEGDNLILRRQNGGVARVCRECKLARARIDNARYALAQKEARGG